ncbi:MAG: hypothetical protein HGA36_01770 [Candidatus Moranbacteria bacterium]|nr:hypothetical protein [Candidatus Moranbacteria bacterium]
MPIEDYMYGKVSPVKNKKGENDISKDEAKKATGALHKEIISKERIASKSFRIEPVTEHHQKFLDKNFEDALTQLAKDFEKIKEAKRDLDINDEEKKLRALTYDMSVRSFEERLVNLQLMNKENGNQFSEGLSNVAEGFKDLMEETESDIEMRA